MPTAPNTTTMSTDELREYEQAHGRLTPTQARDRFQYRARRIQARAAWADLDDAARAPWQFEDFAHAWAMQDSPRV